MQAGMLLTAPLLNLPSPTSRTQLQVGLQPEAANIHCPLLSALAGAHRALALSLPLSRLSAVSIFHFLEKCLLKEAAEKCEAQTCFKKGRGPMSLLRRVHGAV